MTSAALLGILVAAGIVVVLLGLLYRAALRRNRAHGGEGFVQHSRLDCPKCHRQFDYTWIPGAALNAVRLGRSRYMACPLCGKWSIFNIWDAPVPPLERGAELSPPPPAPPTS